MIYLCLGTNIGSRADNLRTAIHLLEKNGVTIIKKTGLYESEPVGVKSQPDYNNICLQVETQLDPEKLLETAKKIEKDMGRVRSDRWGQRIIDIDILFYKNIIIDSEKLKIPHPEIAARRFVLEPLSEIAADFVHPALKLTIKELLKNGNFSESVKKIGEL